MAREGVRGIYLGFLKSCVFSAITLKTAARKQPWSVLIFTTHKGARGLNLAQLLNNFL